jgi:aminocarboxymuconate-semialdehyde decarboxylase
VTRVIDLHAHVSTPACETLLDGPAPARLDPFTLFSGPETAAYNAAQFASLAGRLTDPAQRLADMDRSGIDVQAISAAPPQFYYWTDPALGRRLARMQNEHLANIARDRPDRFVALATVPLQDVEAAVAELHHCVHELGMRGVEICTNVNGLDLDAPRFRPLFAAAAELGVPMLLHPHGFTGGERLTEYYLTNVVGNPLDTTVAAARMIHSGLLEELPNLALVFVHGGGYLPFYSSRMDHAWARRPEGRHRIPDRPPSEYLRRCYVDALVYDATHLDFLVRQMGVDHVVVGTDYPYDMGDERIVGLIRSAGLSEQAADKILGGTAGALLGLEPTSCERPQQTR